MTEEKKAVELIGIDVGNDIFFPDYKGTRVVRSVKCPDKLHKLVFNVPVDAETLNVKPDDFAKRAALQISYGGDSNLRNVLVEDTKNGVDFGQVTDVTKYAKAFQDGITTPATRQPGKAAELKAKAAKVDSIEKEFGSLDELIAFARSKKAKSQK